MDLLKSVKEKIKLLTNAIIKNTIEIVFINVVALGKLRIIPIEKSNVIEKNKKLPMVNNSLFSKE